jgi:outer membrane receptor protein involved in Fe transport
VQVRPGVTIDVDAAWSTARYRIDPYAEGRTIPDTARAVIGGGVNVAFSRVGASLRGRYVGRRPLAPAGDLFIASSFVVNGQAEVRVSRRVRVAIEAFNLLDRRYADTAYYFATRLRDPQTGTLEATAVMDYVTHPARPRTLRAGVRLGL